MIAAPAIPAPRVPWVDVDACEARLAEHLSAAIRRFGAVALGLVDLPPIETARPSRAELGVASVLLWAYHVDEAGLLPFVDALADGVTRGSLPVPITGAAVRKLVRWQRGRNDRFSAEERQALYERVLGESVATGLRLLVDALCEIGRAPVPQQTSRLHVRAGLAAREVAGELSARATGIAGFAARDIVAQVREALDILGDAELGAALGGGGVWAIVARHAPSVLGRGVDVERGVSRALAGRTLVSWLADNVAAVTAGTVRPRPDDEVVRAALAYQAEGA